MKRPYEIKKWKFVGGMAVILSLFMIVLYMPGMPSGLGVPEWVIIGSWALLGVIFFIYAKKKFPDFGRALNIKLEEVPEEK